MPSREFPGAFRVPRNAGALRGTRVGTPCAGRLTPRVPPKRASFETPDTGSDILTCALSVRLVLARARAFPAF